MSDAKINFGELVESLKNTFRDFDPDSSGAIEPNILSDVLCECDPSLTRDELDILFRHADKNEDGAIQYNELIDLIFELGGEASDMPKAAEEEAAGDEEPCCAVAMVDEPMEMCYMPPAEPETLKSELERTRKHRIHKENMELLRTSTDKDQVLEVLRQEGEHGWPNWSNFERVNEKVRADREFALAAVTDYGEAVRYLPNKLKADREIATAAVKQLAHAITWIDDALKDDYGLMMSAVTRKGDVLERLTDAGKNNKAVVAAAVQQDPFAIQFASKELRDNRELAFLVVSLNHFGLNYMADRFKEDREVILAALSKKESGVLQVISESSLKVDPEIVQLALTVDYHGIQFIGSEDKFAAKTLSVYKCVHPEGCHMEYREYVEDDFADLDPCPTKHEAKYGERVKPVPDSPRAARRRRDPDIRFNEEVQICAEVAPNDICHFRDKSQGLFLAIPRVEIGKLMSGDPKYKPGGWAREFYEDGTRVLEKVSSGSFSISCANMSGSEATWGFETRDGYTPFADDCQDFIELGYQKFKKGQSARISIKTGGRAVAIDFNEMTQQVVGGGRTRKIRRTPTAP
mmetsp:Transcript_21055/g.39168  ORF Transcript_21055/g.39168 Transcript_21055/m.39168 type:complete len:576 (+) Transcript_21055:110-1837(+)